MASHPNDTTSSVRDLIPTEFIAMGKKHFDEYAKAQTEFLGRLQDANQNGSITCRLRLEAFPTSAQR
jgi:hypothetical protein